MLKEMHRMRERYFSKDYKITHIFKDLLAGLIVGLISIPISMGYAQVSGIPMEYGLYGSLLPILTFAILSTTRNFVFGVDAAPAALVAGTLVSLGISAESYAAMQVVPTMAFLVCIWMIFFFIIKAGRIVKYISVPVMGGFVTGICCTVILMQFPKLFGGMAGVGEAFHLIVQIKEQAILFHPLSFALGIGTLIILLIMKKLLPKFPMPVLMMVVGVWLTKRYHVDEMGVKLLPHVESGLPSVILPHMSWQLLVDLFFPSLMVATVILAETLLASKQVALKDGYSINANKEVFAYAIGNLMSGVFGCLPVNGSVSRTGLARQYGAGSQLMSVMASFTMLMVLLYGTGYIEYMPVPVLTAIVISALIGACEFDLAVKLWKTSRVECYIFLSAFLGVLIFGTIYGVIIGMLLSFILVIYRAVIPPRAFLGVIPGRKGFFDLKRHKSARRIKKTVIYRFSGNLFFANIDTFQDDIENSVLEDTKQVIVNAAGITQIDVTAAERVLLLKRKLEKKGIQFYLTEHLGDINDKLRLYQALELITGGNVRRTMELALKDCGLIEPYPLVGETDNELPVSEGKEEVKDLKTVKDDTELEWAFGDGASEMKHKLVLEIYEKLKELPEGTVIDVNTLVEIEKDNSWGTMALMDEDELLELLETELTRRKVEDEKKRRSLENALEERKEQIASHLNDVNSKTFQLLEKRRKIYERNLKDNEPDVYEKLIRMRISHIQHVEKVDVKLAEKLKKKYGLENIGM